MVTALHAGLAWLAASAGCGLLVLTLDGWDRLAARWTKRRRARRVDPLRLDGRSDPVEQAYADNGIALDVEPAPADDELPTVDEAEMRSLLVEIYKAQTRARFKGIYGEDGQ